MLKCCKARRHGRRWLWQADGCWREIGDRWYVSMSVGRKSVLNMQ